MRPLASATSHADGNRFLLVHVCLIPVCLALAALFVHGSGLDERISAAFFDPAARSFPAREWPLLEVLGHRVAKSAIVGLWLIIVSAAAAATLLPHLREHRSIFWTTALAMALGPTIVVALKDLNGYRCPWDLVQFGGLAEYGGGWFVSKVNAGRCFPSGHAAGGFSLVALFFAGCALDNPRLQRVGLAAALTAGCVFSLVRVAQGAHFLSHNLWSAAIDWCAAALVFAPAMLAARTNDAAPRPTIPCDSGCESTPRSAVAGWRRIRLATSHFLERLRRSGSRSLWPRNSMASTRTDARGRRLDLSTDTIVLLASVYLVAFANTAFWQRALAGRAFGDWHTWSFTAAVAVILIAIHFLLIVPFATRRTVRPLLAALALISLSANHFMQRYGIVVDASMVRNVIHTDAREAAELITGDLLASIGAGVLPIALLFGVRIRTQIKRRVLARRLAAMAAAVSAAACALMLVYQDFGVLMRTDKSLRYKINPAAALWSLGHLFAVDAYATNAPRDPPEAARRRPVSGARKPTLLVMVVGETARAANFSLNGYARPTNPELSRLDVINFAHVRACGTSTEVSVPCMFSPYGRTDYDEARIGRHESLLHVLSHAGFRVIWLDNQGGCKGVCDGLHYRNLSHESLPEICPGDRCFDEVLSHELARIVAHASGDLVVVLHQLGNHGPAYFRRYPAAFKRFTPACEKEQLRDCSADEIVNAYDNGIAYTDRFLAGIIGLLEPLRTRFDAAMLYVSDHGESLGEMGLFLHGLPYAIAPSEQLRVPMLWWLPTESAADLGVDLACLQSRSAAEASHDNIYHSVLGLLDVDTPRYLKTRDLFAECRPRTAHRQG